MRTGDGTRGTRGEGRVTVFMNWKCNLDPYIYERTIVFRELLLPI